MTRWISLILALGLAAAAGAQDRSNYKLGSDDMVQIQVWQRPDLSGTFLVDTDGNVVLPILGEVRAEGLTPELLAAELERRYGIIDPGISEVLVTITQFGSIHLNIVGEVRAAGRQAYREMPTIWDALLSAGGQTPNADMSRVQVVRRSEEGLIPTTINVDLSRGVEWTPADALPALESGDNIIVPSVEEGVVAGDQIQVLGLVGRPGAYPLRAADSVVEAISISGGAFPNADLSRVRLVRPSETGILVYHLDMEGYLMDGYPAADMPLRPGDTITIPQESGGFGGLFRGALSLVPLITAATSLFFLANNLNN